MARYIVKAPDGSKHIIEGPDDAGQTAAPTPQPSGATAPAEPGDNTPLHAFGAGMGDTFFGLGNYYSASVKYLGDAAGGHPRDFTDELEAVNAENDARFQANPNSYRLGEVAGVGAGAVAGGELASGVRMIPAVSRAAEAVDNMGATGRTLAKGSTLVGGGAVVGANQGFADTGTPQGAEAGALTGAATAIPAAGVARVFAGPSAAALALIAKHAKLPGETIKAASDRIAAAAQDFQAKFGRMPSIAEMLDHTQAREIATTIGTNSGASSTAAANEEDLATQRQGELAGAMANGQSTPAAQDVQVGATRRLDKVMTKIGDQHVPIPPTHAADLTSPDIYAVLRGSSYAPAREALNDVRDNGATSISLRDLEAIRLAAARASKSSDPVQANNYGALRDTVREIADQHPGYKAAMGDYAQHMRYAENLDTGAAGLNPTTKPVDFRAGYVNQPTDANGNISPVGASAQAGQRAGMRTQLAATATRSPNSAAELAADLTNNSGLNDKITTAMGPQEAARLRDVGTTAYKAGRGQAAAVPPQRSATSEDTQAASHAIRAATLGLHGGSSSFVAHNMDWLRTKLSLPPGTARKLAEMSTDPVNTPAVMNYLRARGGSAAMRREYLANLRAQAAGVTAAATVSGQGGAGYAGQQQ